MRGRRSMRAPALGGLLAAVLSPAVAEAQLLPNLPTLKRQRIDCSQELPVYGLYRHKYYGYYPTCWRQFPPGWGCPSNESPNWEAELARQPLDIPEEGGLGPGGFGGLGPDPFESGAGGNPLPDLPGQRSPFELDDPGAGSSPFDRPSTSRPPSPFNTDPFESPAPGGEDAPDRSAPPRSPFDMPGASASPSELPSLTPPVTEASEVAPGAVAIAERADAAPELAVIPDARPRPVRLPPALTDPIPPGMPTTVSGGGMAPGMVQPMGIPGEMMPASTTIAPMGAVPMGAVPVGGPVPRGVVISEPTYDGSGSVIMGPSEVRPRRRFLSGLFGRDN